MTLLLLAALRLAWPPMEMGDDGHMPLLIWSTKIPYCRPQITVVEPAIAEGCMEVIDREGET